MGNIEFTRGNNSSALFLHYDENTLKEPYGEILDDVFSTAIIEMPDQSQPSDYVKSIGNKLVELAGFMSILSKHNAYQHEKEYRLLKIYNAAEPLPEEIKTRYREYDAIQYTELNWEGALKFIKVGPAANQPKAKKFAEDCLAEFGITDVTVNCSDIPYRSFRG